MTVRPEGVRVEARGSQMCIYEEFLSTGALIWDNFHKRYHYKGIGGVSAPSSSMVHRGCRIFASQMRGKKTVSPYMVQKCNIPVTRFFSQPHFLRGELDNAWFYGRLRVLAQTVLTGVFKRAGVPQGTNPHDTHQPETRVNRTGHGGKLGAESKLRNTKNSPGVFA